MAQQFDDPIALRTMYIALVRSKLEYCSAVWAPYYIGPIGLIENVQKNFLKFLNKFEASIDYDGLCMKFKLDKLSTRRKLASAMLCFDLLSHRFNDSNLLSQINFYCPTRIFRNNEFLRPVRHVTNYSKNNPVNVMQSNFNLVQQFFDVNVSRDTFKTLSLDYFRN